MEVISTELNGNGTLSTAVDVNQLQSHHRRTRRSSKEIDLASFQTTISHKVLRATASKYEESHDSSENSDFFLLRQKDPFGELFSEIYFQSSSELTFL